MKQAIYVLLGVLSTALLPADSSALGIQLGPFELEFNAGIRTNRAARFEDPVCYAISRHKKLEMVLIWDEQKDKSETKIMNKRIVIEPYIYGIGEKGQPILKGNIVSEKMLREVSIKDYEENDHEEDQSDNERGRRGFFSGLFRGSDKESKDKGIDIRRVTAIRVLEDSSFKAPKDLKGFKTDDIDVICSILPPSED